MRDNHIYLRVQIVVQMWCRWVQMGCSKGVVFSICTLIFPFYDLNLSLVVQGCSSKDWYQTRFLRVLAAGIRTLSPSFLVPQYGKSNLLLVFRFVFRLYVYESQIDDFCARFRLAKVFRGRENARKEGNYYMDLGWFCYQKWYRL